MLTAAYIIILIMACIITAQTSQANCRDRIECMRIDKLCAEHQRNSWEYKYRELEKQLDEIRGTMPPPLKIDKQWVD